MEDFLETLKGLITANNIALLSVIVTLLIFIISRTAEIKYKKHDDKKVQYLKLIALIEKTFTGLKKDKKGMVILDNDTKKLFFDTGASLLMYGSKKIYKLYLLFREVTTNPLIKQCVYYKDDISIYIISEIFVAMRKEVGLSFFNNIANNDALAFFINDISSNPIAKTKAIEAKFRIRMVRFELILVDISKLVFLKKLFYILIKPTLGAIRIILKYLVSIPLGRLITKLFPKFSEKVTKKNK